MKIYRTCHKSSLNLANFNNYTELLLDLHKILHVHQVDLAGQTTKAKPDCVRKCNAPLAGAETNCAESPTKVIIFIAIKAERTALPVSNILAASASTHQSRPYLQL